MLVRTLDVLRAAARLFSARGARFLGAAVAFYAMLSAAPLFVVVLWAVGSAFGRGKAEDALWQGLATWLGPQGTATMRTLTERLEQVESSRSVLGAGLVVYGSTRCFRALRRAINQIWGIELEVVEAARPRHVKYGVRYGGALLLTLLVIVLVGLLVLIKAAFSMVATLGARPAPGVLWALDLGVSFAFAFVLFTALFRLLPEAPVTLLQAAKSAAVSTVLFALGSSAVTFYVQHERMGDLYEGAAAVVVVVVWIYYSAQVFFFGAAIGAVLAAPPAPTVESTGRRVA